MHITKKAKGENPFFIHLTAAMEFLTRLTEVPNDQNSQKQRIISPGSK